MPDGVWGSLGSWWGGLLTDVNYFSLRTTTRSSRGQGLWGRGCVPPEMVRGSDGSDTPAASMAVHACRLMSRRVLFPAWAPAASCQRAPGCTPALISMPGLGGWENPGPWMARQML